MKLARLFLMLFLVWAACVDLAQAAQPNIVLFITDDQGYPDLSATGNPHLKTPAIDSIAQSGVALERFYVSPVCSPTRASLMTGRYNYRTGVVDTYIGRSMMRPTEVTLAERLRDAGYRTGIFGKWHLGDEYPLRSIDQGFEETLVCRGGGLAQPSGPPENGYFNPRLDHNGAEKPYTGYCTDIFTDAALEYITAKKDEPFFAYVAYNAPHDPLQVEDRYAQPFLDMGLDEKTARIYGMIVNIDENVARILAKLRELSLEENTIVLFMTDNGAAYGDKEQRYTAGLRGRKGQVYEGGIRVPCFIQWKGRVPAGRKLSEPVAHYDLFPTLLEAVGVPEGDGPARDGRSVWPQVIGATSPPASPDPLQRGTERAIFMQWHRGDAPRAFENSAVVEARWKLVNGAELYDLLADPGEAKDIAAEQPEEVARLRAAYEAWFADVSSEGYAPPRIVLGAVQSPETRLTGQDWRGCPDFGAANASYWEVATEEGGLFSIELEFVQPLKNATARITIAGETHEVSVSADAVSVRFEGIHLPPQLEDRLAFEVQHEGERKAVRSARVRRK